MRDGKRLYLRRCLQTFRSLLSSTLTGSLRFLPIGEAYKLRVVLLRLAGAKVGRFVTLYGAQLIVNPVNLSIGDSTFINVDCLFEASGTIVIGRQCWFGPRVMVLTSNHVGEERTLEFLPVTVGDRVWIGAGATIVPGVTIGNDAVVAAGSVVTKNLPANARVAGVPARAM